MTSKWSTAYFADLGERVASTAIYGGITLLTANGVTDVTTELGWTIVGLPTVLALLKGLLANLKDSESGASLLPSPPGPEVNEDGNANLWTIVLTLGALVLALIALSLLGVDINAS